jgi:tripartite-type tricarboxylate transporter receptor subunit TctC
MTRRLHSIIALVYLLVVALAGEAWAQTDNYPSKPVRIIVDSAAGSANDVILRIVADRLTSIWGQQVLTVNNPGAGGGIAARAAATSPADGLTLFFPSASAFLALPNTPGTSSNLPIELPRDFAPIAFVIHQPMFIGVSHSLGISSVPELIALAKQKPGEIAFAATGRGRITHLTMELLQSRAGIKLQFVPYTGGPAQAMNDVMSGRVGIVLDGYAGVAPALQGNSIKGLAVTSTERLPGFADLPTMSETLPGFIAGGWSVLVAPLGTPDAIVRKVASDVRKVLDEPEVTNKLATIGVYPRHMTPEEVSAFARSEQQTWRPVLEQVAKQSQ